MRDKIEKAFRERLNAIHVEVIDESHLHAGHAGARDGGQHFRAVIVSEAFAGLSSVRAQQLVYKSVEEWMGKEIHALSMKTFTPDEWATEQAQKTGKA